MKTKTHRNSGASIGVLTLGLLGLISSEALAERLISTTGVAVTTGDYGTGDDTTVTQFYETLKYRMEKGEIGVTVPYLFRDGGGVTAGETSRAQGGAIPEEADGLGDVQLKGKYFWLEETEASPGIDWAGRVKLPTASDEDGLGTGKVDVGFGPELYKWFKSLIVFGNLELVVRDKPSGSTIKSTRLDYSVGTGYRFTDRFSSYLSLDGGTPSSSGTDAPLEWVLSSIYRLTATADLEGYVLAGLSDGSPDVGGGLAVRFRF